MQFVATVIIDTEDSFQDRKPDLFMVSGLLKNKLFVGDYKEKLFRQQILMKINNIQINVMKVD